MFASLLIANRGEIASRIARTAKRLGMRSIAVASGPDLGSPHTLASDETVAIGGERPADSYLRIDKLLDAARQCNAEALHPGYGFLAENAPFAQAVIDAGLVWIGPPPQAMRAMGDKAAARQHAASLGVPVVPGYDGADQDDTRLAREGARIGYPLMIKASAGGGGRGMRVVAGAAQLQDALHSARREAMSAFGADRLVLEHAVQHARHVEFQVFGDTSGQVIHLGERDCSVQRRHQKLIEEAPCPALTPALRREMGGCAVRLAAAIGYIGAGTVEMLLGADGRFWFMEMNTRLQVEHPVTEALLGIDLVEWQLRVAAGEPLPLGQDEALARYESGGHAIEARLCAEDALHDDLPQAGRVHAWQPPPGIRIDHALASGQPIATFYDSMLAKLIAHAPSRDLARSQLARALDQTRCLGVATNRGLLAAVLRHEAFAHGDVTTDFLQRHFADRAASLPNPDGEHTALAALWLATHGAFAIPPEWTRSALIAPRETTLPLAVGEQHERWRVTNERGAWHVEGPRGAYRFRALEWSRDAALQTLAAIGSRGLRLEAVLHDNELFGRIEGIDLHLIDLRLVAARRERGAANGALRPPMHGRLLQLNVALGDTVEAGQIVAVLEAMKMEHALAAPVAGIVSALHVAPGAQVAPSQVLLEISPP